MGEIESVRKKMLTDARIGIIYGDGCFKSRDYDKAKTNYLEAIAKLLYRQAIKEV